jgi:hypothetical protein
MCRSSFKNQIPAPPASNKLLLYSLNCYREDSNGQTPSNAAKLTTIFAFAAFLVLLENTWRYILLSYSVSAIKLLTLLERKQPFLTLFLCIILKTAEPSPSSGR